MKTTAKIIITVFLLLVIFFIMGVPMPYFFGRIFLKFALMGIVIYGIVAVWKKKNQ